MKRLLVGKVNLKPSKFPPEETNKEWWNWTKDNCNFPKKTKNWEETLSNLIFIFIRLGFNLLFTKDKETAKTIKWEEASLNFLSRLAPSRATNLKSASCKTIWKKCPNNTMPNKTNSMNSDSKWNSKTLYAYTLL